MKYIQNFEYIKRRQQKVIQNKKGLLQKLPSAQPLLKFLKKSPDLLFQSSMYVNDTLWVELRVSWFLNP